MFKTVQNRVWAFDLEWVPDPLAGRLVYGLGDELTDLEVLVEMWRRGGASDDARSTAERPHSMQNLARGGSSAPHPSQ